MSYKVELIFLEIGGDFVLNPRSFLVEKNTSTGSFLSRNAVKKCGNKVLFRLGFNGIYWESKQV